MRNSQLVFMSKLFITSSLSHREKDNGWICFHLHETLEKLSSVYPSVFDFKCVSIRDDCERFAHHALLAAVFDSDCEVVVDKILGQHEAALPSINVMSSVKGLIVLISQQHGLT